MSQVHIDRMRATLALRFFDEQHIRTGQRTGQAPHRGGWKQVRSSVEAARLLRNELQAGLEAVAQRFALIWDEVREAVPGIGEIVVSGGALLRSPAWMQIVADVLGHEVVASAEPEGSSRGAALIALELLGAARAEDVPAPLGVVVSPDPERHARYREARARHFEVEAALGPLQDALLDRSDSRPDRVE